MPAPAAEATRGGIARQQMDADIVCVGFGPATAGFLATLSKRAVRNDGSVALESVVAPGQPLQVICYERADDLGFGVSGLVTRARALRETFPELGTAGIPMSTPVAEERVVYLLDPIGASRRSAAFRAGDRLLRAAGRVARVRHEALELPWTPSFLHKSGGLVLSLGQLMQWVGAQILGLGVAQIWPSSPVSDVLIEGEKVVGVRLMDQGVDRAGKPAEGFLPGMETRAGLTVVGDGPTGRIGRQLDEHFGVPAGHHTHDWAAGMKVVVDLPADSPLEPGTVIHTLGFPEPEIFGFFYVHPERVASLGIFVPSWFGSPVRTAYRYLQHWMKHPYLWRYLAGGTLRSWGAKTLGESGLDGEPYLVGDGFARIGEGSGSTNVLTGSGVDEAWATGVQLGEAVAELLEGRRPFTRQNLEETYVRRRRASWVEREALVAAHARDGFRRGVLRGFVGMAMTGLSGGRLSWPSTSVPPNQLVASLNEYCRGRIAPEELEKIRARCQAEGRPLHDAILDQLGWPPVEFDGRLLVSHPDALLLGGKVQAPAGYEDHVIFSRSTLCEQCGARVCIELCSGQAIAPGAGGPPVFDRDKCVHCGVCLWNCAMPAPDGPGAANVDFRAGPGGLHSAEN